MYYHQLSTPSLWQLFCFKRGAHDSSWLKSRLWMILKEFWMQHNDHSFFALAEGVVYCNQHGEICMKYTEKEMQKSLERCGQRCLFFVVDDKSRFGLFGSCGPSWRLAAHNSATPITCKKERSLCLGLHGNGYLILQVDANESRWGGLVASNFLLVLRTKLNSKQKMEINMFYHSKCNESEWSCDQMDYNLTLSTFSVTPLKGNA